MEHQYWSKNGIYTSGCFYYFLCKDFIGGLIMKHLLLIFILIASNNINESLIRKPLEMDDKFYQIIYQDFPDNELVSREWKKGVDIYFPRMRDLRKSKCIEDKNGSCYNERVDNHIYFEMINRWY